MASPKRDGLRVDFLKDAFLKEAFAERFTFDAEGLFSPLMRTKIQGFEEVSEVLCIYCKPTSV